MRNGLLVLALNSFVLLATACSGDLGALNPYDPETPVDKQEKARLAGTVLGLATAADDALPLEGALVTLGGPTDPPGNPAITGNDGTFNFGELVPGVYGLDITHPSHFLLSQVVILEPGEVRDLELVLNQVPEGLGADNGHVTGIIHKDAELNLPVEHQDHSGVTAEVVGAGLRTTTNAAGQFDLYVTAGAYELTFSAPNYQTGGPESVVVIAGETTVIPTSPLVLASNPGQVVGTVRLEEAPADGHGNIDVVLLGSESTQTAPDGSFVINDVPAGNFTLTVSMTDYDAQSLPGITVRGGFATQVPAITLRRSRGRVVGQVELIGTGDDDYSGVDISLNHTPFGTTSSYTGEFALEAVPTGTYELIATKDEFSRVNEGGVVVTANGTLNIGLLQLVRQQGNFQIDGGLDFTNDIAGQVALTLVAPDGSTQWKVEGSLDPTESTDWRDWDPVATSYVLLSAGDGLKNLTVTFRDADLLESPPFSDSITLDRQAPVAIPGESPVLINGGAAFSKNDTGLVSVSFHVTDAGSGVSHFRVSNDGVFDLSPPGEEWQSFVGATTHYLADPATQGAKTIYVEFRDFAGNGTTVDSDTTVSVTLDYEQPVITVAPVLTCPNEVTAGYCNRDTVFVTLTATDNFDPSPNGVTWMALANEEGFLVEDFRPYVSVQSWILSAQDGFKTVNIMLRDAAGNKTTPVTATISLDTGAPASARVSVDEGPYVSNPAIHLTLGAVGADQMRVDQFDEDGNATIGVWEPYGTAKTLTLSPATNGNKRLEARFRDWAGNAADQVAVAETELDQARPEGVSVSINGGASRTDTVSVVLNLTGYDVGSGVGGLFLADTQGDLDGAIAVPFEPTKVWTLSGLTTPGLEESREVWARVVDEAGNPSVDVSDSIIFDSAAPTGSLTPGASVSRDTLVELILTYSADVSLMKISTGDLCAGGSWVAVTDRPQWTLPEADGDYDLSVRFRDQVGHESPCYDTTVALDTTPPAPDSFTVAGNGADPGYTNSTTVTITASADDTDCAETQLAEDVGFVNITLTELSCTLTDVSYDLAITTEGRRDIFVRFLDSLGNPGPLAQASVTLDQTPPVVGDGGFLIREGLWTHQTSLHLDSSVTGADQMQVFEGSCGGTWQGYTATYAYDLIDPVTNEAKTIAVRYRDLADNFGEDTIGTTCFTAIANLDTGIPSFAAGLVGREIPPVAGRTAQQVVTLELSGISTDAVEMLVSNQQDLPGAQWQPLPSGDSMDWVLEPGNGLKTVRVVIRDRAGNPSSEVAPTITLDQTPPVAPALQIYDNDSPADGFALSDATVELLWSEPPDAAGYRLERYVQGVDTEFTELISLSAPVFWYDDILAGTAGRSHHYRIRATDDVGNASAWSGIAVAMPYEPIVEMEWLKTEEGYRYDFPPNQGTFTILPSFVYQELAWGVVQEMLPFNTPFWFQERSTVQYEESLRLRTANQDSSLVFESTFDLGHGSRATIYAANYVGKYASLASDNDGHLHVAFYDEAGPWSSLRYATDRTGVWEMTIADPGPGNVGQYASLALDSAGNAHVAYRDATNGNLKYATNATGSWVATTAHSSIDDVGQYASLVLDSSDRAHIAYYHAGLDMLWYATNRSGAWQNQGVDIFRANTGTHASIAIDSTGDLHISHFDSATRDLVYNRGRWDNWAGTETIDADGDTGQYTSIAVDDLDGLHMVYYETTAEQLKYVRYDGFGWVPETVDAGGVGTYAALAVGPGDAVHIGYYDAGQADLKYATRSFDSLGGEWRIATLDTVGDVGSHVSVVTDDTGMAHFAYYDASSQDLRYASRQAGLPLARRAVWQGLGSSVVAADSAGTPHVASYDGSTFDLVYSTRVSGAWVDTVLATNDAGQLAGITVDSADHVHIAYSAQDTGSNNLFYATNATGVWQAEVVDPTASMISRPSIAVDDSGWIAICYADVTTNDILYLSNELGGVWPAGPEVVETGGSFGREFTSMALNSNGKAHVTYTNFTTSDLHYATNETGVWVAGPLVSDGYVGFAAGLAVDAADRVSIAYYDYSKGDLFLLERPSGWTPWEPWVESTIAASGRVGRYVSLAVDDAGDKHVIYWDETDPMGTHSLEYATNRYGGWLKTTLSSGQVSHRVNLVIDANGGGHVGMGSAHYMYGFLGTSTAQAIDRTTAF